MITLGFIISAFVAGVLMFLAPCTLPIVPGYLAFISGVPAAGLIDPTRKNKLRWKILKNALFFVLGFSIIFILFGAFAGALGALLGPLRYEIARWGGLLIIFFGLMLLGAFRTPSFLAERRLKLPAFLTLGHETSSFLVGALFALGWSPCIGPILGSILLLASTSGTALQGAFLLGVFSLGLAVPMLLVAALAGEATVLFARLGGFLRGLSVVGGIFLVFIGVLMVLGETALLVTYGYRLFDFIGYDKLLEYL